MSEITNPDIWNKAQTQEDPLIQEAKKYKTAEEFIDSQNLPKFEGKGYRADSGFSNKGSAFDVIKFESDELGNIQEYQHLSPDTINLLKDVSAKDIVWVTKTKDDASRYGEVDDVYDLGENPRIVAEDGDGGFLVLKSKGTKRLTDIWNKAQEAGKPPRATQQLKTISKKKLNDIVKKNPEGFTVDRNGVPVTKGFVSGVTNGLGWKGQDIDFIHDVVKKNDQLGYGGWSPKGRAPEIDANMVFDTKDEALKFARKYSQEKIFDLDTFEETELKYTKGEIAAFKKNPPDFTKPLNLPARKGTKQPTKKLQAIPTQTKEFKKWFKKSEVVDESGEPLGVYHGTVATFEEFKSQKDKARTLGSDRVHRDTGKDAFYFAEDPKIAGDYAKKEGGQIYPVYLSMQKPAVIDGKGESWTSVHRKVVAAIKSGKYDGVIVKNTADYYDSPGYAFENPTTVYIVLKPTQIKSIYNEGTFSEKDPRISRQLKKKKAKPKTKEEILYNIIDAYRHGLKPATIPTGVSTSEENRRYRHRLKALEDYLSHIMDSTTIDIGKASKWWSEDVEEMIAGMEKELPGISEDRTETLQMKLLLSITSQGMLLDLNHKQTLYLLHERRATGRYPLWKPGGATNIDTHALWRTQLSKINRLEKYFKGDWEAITGWLIGDEITVKELREYLVAMGYTEKRAKTLAKDENGSTAVGATGYPAMIFGVKIGSMLGALHDVNLSALDIWMSRIEMVATGDINIDKKTGRLADLPKHREVFHEAIRNVAKKHGYEGHEIQSTSWVHIKELFHEIGTPRSSSYFTESMKKREKAYDKFTTTYAETISEIGEARARRAFARWKSLEEGLQKRTDPFKEPDGEEYKKAPLARQGGKTQQLKVVTLEDRRIAKEKKAAVDEIRMRGAKDKAEEIPEFIRNRRSYIDLHTLEMNSFIHELNKKTTKKERELIPFIIEKTEVPDALNRPDLQELDSEETRVRLRAIVASVEKEFKKTWISIVEANPDLDGKDILNYVTHIWVIPKNKRADVVTWFTSHNKWLESRYIETIAEGVSVLGLKPKTLDIGEILSIHSSTAHNVIANKKFVADIRALEQDGYRLVTKASLAPAGFVEIRHSAMRDPYTGAYLKAHPDLEKAIKVIFTEINTTSIGHAYDIVAGVLKKTQLSLALFHHIALTETAVALLGGIKVSKIIAELAIGRHPVFRNMKIARDGVMNNLQIGASVDIPVAKIQEALKAFTRITKGVAKPLEVINEKWDAALWEYLHDGFKLFAYEHLVSKLNPNDENITKKKREISAFVNDTFGGQNMDILGINPNTVKWLQRSLLSADWQISTIRQALSSTSIGVAYKENRMMRAKMGASFWIRAFIYYGILMNSLNHLFRKWDKEENPELYPENMSLWDYTMIGNSIGSQTYLFTGRNKDGSEAYLRWGKQFRELPELLYSDIGFNIPYAAIKKVGGKANPMIHLAASVFTGHTASGYEIWDMKDKIGMDKAVGLMKHLLKAPLPFSTKNMMNERRGFKITDLFMPSGKGMGSYKARKFFTISIMDGDYNLWRETYLAAVRNRLPAQKINTQAISALETDLNGERTGIVNSIEEIDKKIASEKDLTQQRYLQGKRARLIKRENDAKAALSVIERAEDEMNRFRKDYNLK